MNEVIQINWNPLSPPRPLASRRVEKIHLESKFLRYLDFPFPTLPRGPGQKACSSRGKFHPLCGPCFPAPSAPRTIWNSPQHLDPDLQYQIFTIFSPICQRDALFSITYHQFLWFPVVFVEFQRFSVDLNRFPQISHQFSLVFTDLHGFSSSCITSHEQSSILIDFHAFSALIINHPWQSIQTF